MDNRDKMFFRQMVKEYYPEKHRELHPDEVLEIEIKKPKRNDKMDKELSLRVLRKQLQDRGISYAAAMTKEECAQAMDMSIRSDKEGIDQLVKAVKERYIKYRQEQKEMNKANESD